MKRLLKGVFCTKKPLNLPKKYVIIIKVCCLKGVSPALGLTPFKHITGGKTNETS